MAVNSICPFLVVSYLYVVPEYLFWDKTLSFNSELLIILLLILVKKNGELIIKVNKKRCVAFWET